MRLNASLREFSNSQGLRSVGQADATTLNPGLLIEHRVSQWHIATEAYAESTIE